MLRLFKDLMRDLVSSNLNAAEPDESLWSPSGWSEAATGPMPELLSAPMAMNTNDSAADRHSA